MLKEIYGNNQVQSDVLHDFINFCTSGIMFIRRCLADKKLLVLDDFYYCNRHKNYILNLRVRNKHEAFKLNVQDIYSKKYLLKLVSSLDAYLIGVVLGLLQNEIIVENGTSIVNYYIYFNDPIVMPALIKIDTLMFADSDNDYIILKHNNSKFTKKLPLIDFSKNPSLLLGLSSTDAFAVGLKSFDSIHAA
jgi:hypothetical protein